MSLIALAGIWYVGLLTLLALSLAAIITTCRFLARHRLALEILVELMQTCLGS